MNGNLEPEENVLSEEHEKSKSYPCEGFTIPVLGKLGYYYEELGWDKDDDIVVEIGGKSVSVVDVGEDYNSKVKYNKDAFIVIKNRNRSPYTPSKAPEDSNES